ncbi:MAG: hypothetical protein ACQEQF_09605 [Bacillota bacterium]
MDTLYFSNVMELANEVKEHLDTEKKKYIARPFNRYNSKNTIWWIVPGNDWPAYKYGKYMFRKKDDNEVSIGLNIEKGYGKKISQMVSHNTIMEDEWIWHEFITAVREDKLYDTFKSLDEKNESDVNITISFGEFNQIDDKSDDHSEKFPDEISYVFKQDVLSVQNKDEKINNQEFEKIKYAGSVREIFEMLAAIKGLSYYWINFFVGVSFKIGHNKGEIDIYKIDRQILSLLEEWVR